MENKEKSVEASKVEVKQEVEKAKVKSEVIVGKKPTIKEVPKKVKAKAVPKNVVPDDNTDEKVSDFETAFWAGKFGVSVKELNKAIIDLQTHSVSKLKEHFNKENKEKK